MPTSQAPFINRQDLSDHLGEDLTSSDSALAAIDAACDVCRNHAEQTFNVVTGDEVTLDGTGTDALLLPELPVTSVGEVAVDGDVVTDYALNGNGVLLRTAPGTWPKRRQVVVVTYDHGYATDTLPRDVRMVALQLATRLMRVVVPGSSESLGQYSISYSAQAAEAGVDLTNGEKDILRRYRRAS